MGEVGWGLFFCSQVMRDTGEQSGMFVRNKWVSPTLFLPLTDFGFKGILPQDFTPRVTP